jgi:hypothetical protein
MADPQDKHDKPLVLNFANNPVVPYPIFPVFSEFWTFK